MAGGYRNGRCDHRPAARQIAEHDGTASGHGLDRRAPLGEYQVVVVEQILGMARGVAGRTAGDIQRDAAGEAGIAHGGRVVVGRRVVDVLRSVAQEQSRAGLSGSGFRGKKRSISAKFNSI